MRRNEIETIDKIEIDSDNIETPPATRKLLNYPRTGTDKPSLTEEEILGDGQFDRFSSARRTRRYRKAQDDDSAKEIAEVAAEKQILRPTTLKVKSQPVDSEDPENKELRLKQWQEKLNTKTDSPVSPLSPVSPEPKKEIKNKIPVLQSSYMRNNRLYSTLPHSFKSRIGSNTNLRNLNAHKLGTQLEEKEITQVSSFIPEIKVRALTPTKTRIEHDLNDEGFEETQSLISDSPSQTTSSGCNYDIDNIDSPSPSMVISDTKPSTFNRTDSSGSGDASGCDSKLKEAKKPEPKSLLPKRTASLRLSKPISCDESSKFARSSSVSRNPNGKSDVKPVERKLNTPSRIKTPSPVIKNNPIQRYPSKSSLKSSRSSLNSCASISTVKNVKPNPKLDNYTKVIKTLSNLQKSSRSPNNNLKKPLTPVQIKNRTNSAAPSRSSSSASSTEPATKRSGSLTLSTSFKENSNEMANDNFHRHNSQSFMRPTASSSAKDMTDSKPKFMIRTPFK